MESRQPGAADHLTHGGQKRTKRNGQVHDDSVLTYCVKGVIAISYYFSVSSHQLNSKNNALVLLLKIILTALKLFPVVCCYGWQR